MKKDGKVEARISVGMRVLGFIGTVFVLFIMIPLLYGSFCLFGLDFEAYSSIPVFFPVLIFLGIFIISSLVGFMKGKDCTCLLFGWHYKDTKTGKTYGVLKMFMASLIHFCIWLQILGVWGYPNPSEKKQHSSSGVEILGAMYVLTHFALFVSTNRDLAQHIMDYDVVSDK